MEFYGYKHTQNFYLIWLNYQFIQKETLLIIKMEIYILDKFLMVWNKGWEL